jgi:hypothetical protein
MALSIEKKFEWGIKGVLGCIGIFLVACSTNTRYWEIALGIYFYLLGVTGFTGAILGYHSNFRGVVATEGSDKNRLSIICGTTLVLALGGMMMYRPVL